MELRVLAPLEYPSFRIAALTSSNDEDVHVLFAVCRHHTYRELYNKNEASVYTSPPEARWLVRSP